MKKMILLPFVIVHAILLAWWFIVLHRTIIQHHDYMAMEYEHVGDTTSSPGDGRP